MTVNVSATFKKDERDYDGLSAIQQELILSPHKTHVIVAVIETTKITHDVRDGSTTPTIRLRLVEVMDGDRAKQCREDLDAVYSLRTGRTAGPDTLFDAPASSDAAAADNDKDGDES